MVATQQSSLCHEQSPAAWGWASPAVAAVLRHGREPGWRHAAGGLGLSLPESRAAPAVAPVHHQLKPTSRPQRPCTYRSGEGTCSSIPTAWRAWRPLWDRAKLMLLPRAKLDVRISAQREQLVTQTPPAWLHHPKSLQQQQVDGGESPIFPQPSTETSSAASC